jgi:hypothetical protein
MAIANAFIRIMRGFELTVRQRPADGCSLAG